MIAIEEKSKIKKVIEDLKEKNIKFELLSEEESLEYLENNNYKNVISYKNNFEVYYIRGKFVDKYINLDFAYLKDLSIIDYHLRKILFSITIDIEYYLKVRILRGLRKINNDGKELVNLFLEKDYYDLNYPKKIHKGIYKHLEKEKQIKYKIEVGKMIKDIEIDDFLDVITFGELVYFYDFYTKKYDLKEERKLIILLRGVVSLRNRVAHNKLLLNKLYLRNNKYLNNKTLKPYLRECGVGRELMYNKLSNIIITEITETLFIYDKIVLSENIKYYTKKEIRKFFYNRIPYHKEYYKNNDLLKSIYKYFDKIIKTYY